jgi:hypothetical protein
MDYIGEADMVHKSGFKKAFPKAADILPHGIDPEEVAKFFSAGASGHMPDKAAMSPFRLGVGIDLSASSDPADDYMLGSAEVEKAHTYDSFKSAHANKSLSNPNFNAEISDFDGSAKPAFKGNGGDGGGGKSKPDRGNKKSDPVVTDETPTTNPTTDPTPTPEPTPTTEPTPVVTIPPADYVSGLDTPDGFNIELMFSGTWTDAAKAEAHAAAERISDIVTGDLPSYNGIDDIRITLTSTTIDGTGGTWGKGGYDILRNDSKLAATGHVTIDAADVPNALKLGLLGDLLQHEMLHAMGFGTGWNAMNLVDNYSEDLRFNGVNATSVYNTLFASVAELDLLSNNGVPIETDGGSGAAGKHWDEATFGAEIMSTTLNYSNDTTLLTVAALEDMGYQTTFFDDFLLA